MSDRNIGIVILAAGESTRFGSPKQLAEIEGKTLIERVSATAVSTGFQTVVVLGANSEPIGERINARSIETVHNEDWQKGLSSSIRVGLTKLLEIQPELSVVILLLADQPSVTKATLENLVNAQYETGKSIAACSYANTAGTPALFTKSLFPELMKLEGDRGAKVLIEKYLETDVALVKAPEAAFDIDTEEDYSRLTGA